MRTAYLRYLLASPMAVLCVYWRVAELICRFSLNMLQYRSLIIQPNAPDGWKCVW